MHDRGRFWTPAQDAGTESFSSDGVTIHVVRGLRQMLVSGRVRVGEGVLAGVAGPFGFSGVASGPAYAAGLARDRILLVTEGEPPLSEGWSAEGGIAATRVDDATLVLDLAGPGLGDLLAKATTLPANVPTPSASIIFAGLPCIGYRTGAASTLRLHVERPLGAALAAWLSGAGA